MSQTLEDAQIVSLTENALKEVKRLIAEDTRPEIGLRLGVKGGGCSGLSYILDLGVKKDMDNIQTSDGFEIYIDKKSSLYLKGMEIAFNSGLVDRGFKFNNPNASNTCGCGTSFSV